MKTMQYNIDSFFGLCASVALILLGKIFNLLMMGLASDMASIASFTLSISLLIINWQKLINAVKLNYYKAKSFFKPKNKNKDASNNN